VCLRIRLSESNLGTPLFTYLSFVTLSPTLERWGRKGPCVYSQSFKFNHSGHESYAGVSRCSCDLPSSVNWEGSAMGKIWKLLKDSRGPFTFFCIYIQGTQICAPNDRKPIAEEAMLPGGHA